jgi:hypothetical protein
VTIGLEVAQVAPVAVEVARVAPVVAAIPVSSISRIIARAVMADPHGPDKVAVASNSVRIGPIDRAREGAANNFVPVAA